MLRKRIRSVEKDRPMGHLKVCDVGSSSEVLGNDQKLNNIFNIPGLFVGLSPKGLSDSDSVKSPTSPLDYRVFSNLCNSPRSPRSPSDRHQKIWDKSKVGLSILDSLGDDLVVTKNSLKSSGSKNILFGPQMRIMPSNGRNHVNSFEAPKSLPANFAIFPQTLTKSRLQKGNDSDVVFEIGDTALGYEPTLKAISCSLDSKNISSQTQLNSMPSEIELSEDYTCVTLHGSNPKTTHIYGDCILDCKVNNASKFEITEELEVKVPPRVQCLENSAPCLSDDFLSFCHSCNKKLEQGKDIYIYRGEKAFCTSECRLREILIEEELEKGFKEYSMNAPELDKDDQLFEAGFFIP